MATINKVIERAMKLHPDTIDDLTARSSVTKTVIETLKNYGCLKGLPESDQLTFF